MPRPAEPPARWWPLLDGRRVGEIIPRRQPGLAACLGLTFACVGAAGLFRLTIDPLVGQQVALATFLAPAALCAFMLGFGWGTLAAALGGGVALLLLVRGSGDGPAVGDLWSLSAFALIATIIVSLMALARSALLTARAERANTEAVNERLQLVSQELSHRIQNIFAVVAGMVTLSVREHPAATAYAEDLLARVRALGSAHDLVRPHGPGGRQADCAMTFSALLDVLFLAYRAAGAERIVVSGADMRLEPAAATPVALLFHELATNSLKYGALSRADGGVSVHATRRGEDVEIVWTETGGPPLQAPPRHSGFGS
ncbi:MAG TPA: sensor histidine kinase, partial [Caulobacter sp.]|nr:sensor histidine kinase [Caulobacter sp.]